MRSFWGILDRFSASILIDQPADTFYGIFRINPGADLTLALAGRLRRSDLEFSAFGLRPVQSTYRSRSVVD